MEKLRRFPFVPRFREAILAGRKTATTRTKRYGGQWDRFDIGGDRTIMLTAPPARLTLGGIALNRWRSEGCKSPEDFMKAWADLHPTRGYQGLDLVWFHRFRLVEKGW